MAPSPFDGCTSRMVLMSFQRLVGAAYPLSSMLICLLRFCLVLFNGVSAAFLGLLFELKSGRVKLQQVARLPHLVCTFFVTGHWCFYAQSFCSSVRFLYPYIRAQILSIIESLCEYVPGQEAASQQAESQQGGLASSLASGPHACACGGGCVCVGVCGGLWGCVGVWGCVRWVCVSVRSPETKGINTNNH